jgi:hypothetical protein
MFYAYTYALAIHVGDHCSSDRPGDLGDSVSGSVIRDARLISENLCVGDNTAYRDLLIITGIATSRTMLLYMFL